MTNGRRSVSTTDITQSWADAGDEEIDMFDNEQVILDLMRF